ncbi:MAG: hypothetical protein GF411_11540 [Candidatus Lokiarchaeota archaeon]|nr:hypothetical protein [Candidatus Lokiarchaeota archaeon]
MRVGNNSRKFASILVIMALFAPYVLIGFTPTHVQAQSTSGTIVFDMSHGQYSDFIFTGQDAELQFWLEAKGYEVIWAFGGINDTILASAEGLIIGSIYGDEYTFSDAEVQAISDWFNPGNKFLWIGADSDFSGAYINANMSKILTAVGSHVYPEQCSVEDPVSNCEAPYRPVATGYSDAEFVENITADVNATLFHGPTCLYGATGGAEGAGPVDLRTTSIPNVYIVSQYSENAKIVNPDDVPPVAHTVDTTGDFVAMTVEVMAGSHQAGIIAVSGASPYGDYQPMFNSEYYNVTLNGFKLVRQAIDWGMQLAPTYEPVPPLNLIPIIGIIGAVVVIVIMIGFIMKK